MTLMSLELDVASAVVPRSASNNSEPTASSGSVSTSFYKPLPSPIPDYLDNQSTIYSILSKEPRSVGPSLDIIPASTIYMVTVPRIASLDQLLTSTTSNQPSSLFSSCSSSISILGLHLLLIRATSTSSLAITVGQHLEDIATSYADLCILNKVRRRRNDRIPIHFSDVLEVVAALDCI